ncbi:MAG: GntP family permease [Candidatus Competibacteraceae bacterium]|nr:GntP family permease [Candidatus Competibacteraceae bacterium]
MTGIIGIVLALALLMYLAYRGISVLILAPTMALLAVLLAGDMPLLGTYTQVFMKALGNFIVQYFPLFLLGAMFGKLMEDSGSARAIAQQIVRRLGRERSLLAVVLSCAVLTYGGVSLFVVAFAVFPVAAALFREADIPRRLIPATIALGAFTFTMTALPGTPAIQNAIPMPYFGTTPFAAPILGILTGIIMFVLGNAWLTHQARRAREAGEGYGAQTDGPNVPDKALRELAQGEGFDVIELSGPAPSGERLPGFAVAIAPIVLVILFNYLFTTFVIPALDTAYLALPQYGATSIEALRGIWSIICALLLSIVLLIGLHWRRFADLKRSLDDGASASVLPIFNTASQVGFGAVIASLAAFALIRDMVLEIGSANPLVSLAISVNILAGITGSASGGMSIALQTLGDAYMDMAQAAGIAPELMHRVTSVATGGLDSLPHNGAVITLLAICGLSHREAYKDIFVVAVLVPIGALIVLIVLGSLFGAL